MGMNVPLGSLQKEDTLLLSPALFANSEVIDQTRIKYATYLKQEKFRECRIGIPYVVEDRVYDPLPWIGAFLHDLPAKATWFFFMDMSLRHDISKWTWSFPEIGENRVLYIKISRRINWNHFLSSIWDFVKNNIQVVLLDTNKVLMHPKHPKILQSLVLRGVQLGFHGEFNLSWWQNESRFVKKLAYLNIVDFWQTQYWDIEHPCSQKEIKNKILYFSKSDSKN